jgi:hypothetical protein
MKKREFPYFAFGHQHCIGKIGDDWRDIANKCTHYIANDPNHLHCFWLKQDLRCTKPIDHLGNELFEI